jgi:hypothetical protein
MALKDRYTDVSMRALRAGLLPLVLLTVACSAPPQKEIDLAQGAIDAARAAGAEQFASSEFTQATDALRQAHDAVAQRDYRLALTRAIDAHERAQTAAKAAADGKARARSEADAAIARATLAVEQLLTRIKTAAAAKISRADLEAARKSAADAEAQLQKARAAVIEGNYAAARTAVGSIPEAMKDAVEALDAAATKKPGRGSRRTR